MAEVQGVIQAHLRNFPTLRDPRIHIVLGGNRLQSSILSHQQRPASDSISKELREDPEVQNSLQRWWEWLPRPKSWMVEWEEFRLLNILCFEDLAPSLAKQYESLPETAAAVDWTCVCKEEKVMNHALFAQSILELSDNFIASSFPNQHAEWLNDLLDRIQQRYRTWHMRAENKASGCDKYIPNDPILPDAFEWPSAANLPEATKRSPEAFHFDKDCFNASSFATMHIGKRKDEPLQPWAGQKYEAWEESIGNDVKEANAMVATRLLTPNPHTSRQTVPHRVSAPKTRPFALGQTEANIECLDCNHQRSQSRTAEMQIELPMNTASRQGSKTRLNLSLNRPFSSQHRRDHDLSEHSKLRPASSHGFFRERPYSALSKRQVGGGGFVADGIRTEYGRGNTSDREFSLVLRPQRAVLTATRPHSAMHLQRPQIEGQDDKGQEPPRRNRPRTSLGHRPDCTDTQSQVTKSGVYTSEAISRRSWLQNMEHAEGLLESEPSYGSCKSDVQYLSAPTNAIADEGSFRLLLRPISANISVRVNGTTRISSRNRQSGSRFDNNIVPVQSVFPVGTKDPESQPGREYGEASNTSIEMARARHAIRTYSQNSINDRSRRLSPPETPCTLSRGVSLASIDDFDEDSLKNISVIFGAGSETPLPQEPSLGNIRPQDDGSYAQWQLGDVLSVRKVWGKAAVAACNREQQMGVPESLPTHSSDPGHEQHLQSSSFQPFSPYQTSYQERNPNEAAESVDSGVERDPYDITHCKLQGQHLPSLFPADQIGRQAHPYMHPRATWKRQRGRAKLEAPLRGGSTEIAASAFQSVKAMPTHITYLKVHGEEPMAVVGQGPERWQPNQTRDNVEPAQLSVSTDEQQGQTQLLSQYSVSSLDQRSWSTLDSTD